jgi:hypothetical protein
MDEIFGDVQRRHDLEYKSAGDAASEKDGFQVVEAAK